MASWIQGADGPTRTIQAIGRDLTTRERYEDQLRQSQKMEAVGKLAAGIAHDFNNLLTAILGFADIAERPLPPDSPSRPPLAQIRRSGQQAAALTRQLLAFARRQILQPVVLDLNAAISRPRHDAVAPARRGRHRLLRAGPRRPARPRRPRRRSSR